MTSPSEDWLKVASQVALMSPLRLAAGVQALGALSLPPYAVAATA